MTELMEKWLWMQTMNYALDVVRWIHQETLFPEDKFHDKKGEGSR